MDTHRIMNSPTPRPVASMASDRRRDRETLRFATASTTLGAIALAVDAAGVVALELAASDDGARRLLAARLPGAELREDADGLHAWLECARAALDDAAACTLALAPRGTEFQRRVWSELRRIPRGTTLAYAELAARVGRPRALRAVAAACRANPIAVLVPCHRVVARDGSLAGFRWGLGCKRALLEREGAVPQRRGARLERECECESVGHEGVA